MQLFLEKEFLNDFYLEFDRDNSTDAQKILYKLFSEFTEMDIFLDCETIEEIKEQTKQNIILNKININNPNAKPIGPFKDYFAGYDKPKQALVFFRNISEWSKNLFNKGFLCFYYDTYKQSIIEIINELHFRIDLSETNNLRVTGWSEFKKFKVLPSNSIVVTDKYILSDKSNQKIDKTLIPFLKNILEEKKETQISVTILTSEKITDIKIAEERLSQLDTKFKLYNLTFSIIKIKEDFFPEVELHDRIVYTNYSILEIGKGFNLSKNIERDGFRSTSQILCETIFNKYTYNRLKNHIKIMGDYIEKLRSHSFETNLFTFYPKDFYNTLLD